MNGMLESKKKAMYVHVLILKSKDHYIKMNFMLFFKCWNLAGTVQWEQ